MWKDWFYYTKGERYVIILLLLFLSVILTLMYIESSSPKALRIEDKTMALTDSLMNKIKEAKKKYIRDTSYYSRKSSAKYNQPAGKNISYTDKRVEIKNSAGQENNFKPKYKKQEKFPEGTLVDVNTADTTTLKKVPGIGNIISRNIVIYRERLGGFYDINQLLEVRYVEPSLLKWFKLESGVYRKLRVNSDNMDVLRNHPYMNYYKAKAIIDYRKKRGDIKNLLQISLLEEFDDTDIDRLSQYVDFQ